MALLFLDSFDHYATADIVEKWTASNTSGGNSLTINTTGGRRSSGCFRWQNGNNSSERAAISKQLAPADATCVAGFAVAVPAGFPSTNGLQIAVILDGATDQVTLRLNSDYTLSVCRGANNGTVLGTTTALLTAGTFVYVEWKVLIHPSAGTVDVRVNGASVLSLTAQNTRNSANSAWTVFALGVVDAVFSSYNTNFLSINYDDLYVLDGSGSAPLNDFLGDCRVDARYPTAEGASSAWTPLSGTDNALMVDETAPDDDTTYNSTATVGATDTHVMQDAPVPGATLYGVQLCLSAKKSDAGTCSLAPVVRHSGTDYPGTAFNPGTTYAYTVTPYGTNPGTSAAWTEAGFNAIELGYTRTA